MIECVHAQLSYGLSCVCLTDLLHLSLSLSFSLLVLLTAKQKKSVTATADAQVVCSERQSSIIRDVCSSCD